MHDNVAFLANDIGRLFRKRFDAASGQAGLTGPQWRLLGAIQRNPGANQIALANFLDVEPITAARMIDRLEKAGLVERRPDPGDRRAWCLHLTEAAQPQIAEARALAEKVIARSLAGIDENDQALLRDLLGRMRDNLSEGCCGLDATEAAKHSSDDDAKVLING
ncbi:MarR family winged helix-turn-helix transcriptional regulator [Novosphingobium tardum]|uniref:MarR family winged helix-turn-helix transcriptional regulator n=1 Tax=Novosphingobium tardum TaxID=1538021 RepID=A0ABV8RNP0_9SPHN